jgi:hypothetical protein
MKKLLVLVVAVVAVVVFGAAQASASSTPIVIPYEKTCYADGHCEGTAGLDGEIVMQVDGPSFRATGKGAELTLTETVTDRGISFTAVMSGHMSPAGFIVLDGTVTEGSFLGAQVHQRSNLTGIDGSTTVWEGELQLMPASA